MQALLQAGALVDLPVADGITPFFATILPATGRARFKTEQQALEAMRVLKAAGADPARAVTAGPRVLHLIHVHTPDHARVPGTTPLMMAAVRGWKDVAKELVSYGMDVNAKDADGMTALDYAMGRERFGFLQVKPSPNPEMAAVLRELGATLETPDPPAWPPLVRAADSTAGARAAVLLNTPGFFPWGVRLPGCARGHGGGLQLAVEEPQDLLEGMRTGALLAVSPCLPPG